MQYLRKSSSYILFYKLFKLQIFVSLSNVYQKIDLYADKLWKFQMYEVIYEYVHKPILVAPFSIISYFVSLLRLVLRPIRKSFFTEIKKGETSLSKRLFYYLSKDWNWGIRNI